MSNTVRKLRIAFSICCGIVCLLLIVMWLRSYWWQDVYLWRLSGFRYLRCSSGRSWVSLNYTSFNPGFEFLAWHGGGSSSYYVENWHPNHIPTPGWLWQLSGNMLMTCVNLTMPYWFLVLLAALPVSPWIRKAKHFSLRTLLIATTLVAVLLGAAVYAVR